MSCISFEQPSVSVSSLFLICSLFFSCSNDGCIWMWYTWLPRASIPQYYSVPTGRRLINDHAFRPQAQYVLMIVIPTCDIWPSYPQQPTGEDGSAASLLEVGVWAIIAKVLATDWNSGAQHDYLFRWGWRRSVGGWGLPLESCLHISWQGLQGSQVCTFKLDYLQTYLPKSNVKWIQRKVVHDV